jgi:uncharacterized protein
VSDDDVPDDEFEDEIAAEGNRIDDVVVADDADDDVDPNREIGAEGNRIEGARARAVVEYVTSWLTDDPDAIDIELQERRGEVKLLIHASPDDVGRLIGRRGRVIQALRQVTRAAGATEGIKASVDVAE